MITDELKQAFRNRAATFYLIEGEFPIEEQLAALDDALPREMHTKGVEPVEECVYWEARVLLQALSALAQDFAEVYEIGYTNGRLPWEPNIQKIEK